MRTIIKSFMPLRHSIIACSAALLVLISFSTCAVGKDLESSDLQGTWKLVYQESGGKKLPDEKTAEMYHGKMVFRGSEIQYTVELPGFDFRFSFLLHSNKQPTGIDLKLVETKDGKGTGKMMLGICRLEGDTLKICYNAAKRPTEFAAAEGSDNMLIVLKKAATSQ